MRSGMVCRRDGPLDGTVGRWPDEGLFCRLRAPGSFRQTRLGHKGLELPRHGPAPGSEDALYVRFFNEVWRFLQHRCQEPVSLGIASAGPDRRLKTSGRQFPERWDRTSGPTDRRAPGGRGSRLGQLDASLGRRPSQMIFCFCHASNVETSS